MLRLFQWLLVILLILLGITFAVLNATTATLHYYVGQVSLPLSLLLLMFFGIGLFIGLGIAFGIWVKLKAKIGALKHQLKKISLEKQSTA